MTEAKQQLIKASKDAKHLITNKADRESASQRSPAANLRAMADSARRIYDAYESGTTSTARAQTTAIKQKLDDALYGKGASKKDGSDNTALTYSGTRANDCKPPSAGKSLIGDMICLCTEDCNSMSNAQPCGFTAGNKASGWPSNAAQQQATWQAIATNCKKMPDIALTPLTIHRAPAAFDAALTATGNNVDITSRAVLVLGQHNAGQCGSAHQARCVDYTPTVNTSPTPATIKWYASLEQTAGELETWNAANAEAKQTDRELQLLRLQAEAAYMAARVNQQPAAAPIKGNAAASTTPSTEAEACNNLKTNTTCIANNCKWEGTTETVGECKSKNGEEGMKSEKDAKLTNTTASNSFVIHKAPLFLAFLLLAQQF